jgi:hypothetical protein
VCNNDNDPKVTFCGTSFGIYTGSGDGSSETCTANGDVVAYGTSPCPAGP